MIISDAMIQMINPKWVCAKLTFDRKLLILPIEEPTKPPIMPPSTSNIRWRFTFINLPPQI